MRITLNILAALSAMLLSAACGSGCDSDVQAPAVPTGVTLARKNASSLSFVWDKMPDAEKYMYRCTQGASSVYEGTTSGTSATIQNLSSGIEYSFSVCSVKGDLKSAFSEAVKGTPGSEESEKPTEPENPGEPSTGGADYSDFGIPAAEEDGAARAFPGAEGGGMYTSGGRGGKVIHVTNLNDSGEGSFRSAVKESGARTIVFDVAGRIELLSDLQIKNGDLTIAGQTAPGDGICISGGTVQIAASNVIVRFVRFRLGDENKGNNLSDGSDCIWGRYNSDIIIDHCSMSWSIDEVASFYANKNFTMQWCLAGEALTNSIHGKGSHGYGGIWGGKNASFHHNMLACNNSRNARIDHPGIYDKYLETHRGNVDYRNNVIYNWGDNSTYGGEDGSFNIVANYYKPGPASKDRKYFVDAYWYNSSSKVGSAYPSLYIDGNVHTGDSGITGDNKKGIYYHDQSQYGTNPAGTVLDKALSIKADDKTACFVTTHTADKACTRVLEYSGASLHRDAVDTRLASDASKGTATCQTGSNGSKGGLIDSQKDVGGWPEYSATQDQKAAVKDSDGDGIPDAIEDKFGLDRNNASDGNAKTLDRNGRYTNLEMYLHYLVKDITARQNEAGSYAGL